MGRKPTATPLEVAAFATAMVTQKELGELLGITQQAVSEMLQKPAYRDAWERARNNTRYELRKAQIEAAKGGDRTMLIWTGKQYLDQKDAPHTIEQHTDVQIRYEAVWGGRHSDELGPAQPVDTIDLIEGEVEDE
jgi:predicted transcriptional regulator